jgi:hypothetical protein
MKRFRFLRRIRRETNGAAAIEFAIVAPVFFMMLWAIFETGLVFFAKQTLTHGLQVTSRQIRTGAAHSSELTPAQFREMVCAQVSYLLSCEPDKLYLDIQSYASFPQGGLGPPVDADGKFDPENADHFDIGESGNISGGSSVVLVRAFYEWPLVTPYMGKFYADEQGGNTILLSASAAFKNEPF